MMIGRASWCVVAWMAWTSLAADGATRIALAPQQGTMAVAAGKPVIVAESSPRRVDLSAPVRAEAAWSSWFEPFFRTVSERPEIRWFHLISHDWTRASYFAASGWENNDLTANAKLLDRLVAELRKPRYLHAAAKAPAADPPARGDRGLAAGTDAGRAELAWWDDPAAHLPPSGPGGTAVPPAAPFDGDPRLSIHRDVVFGRTHPDIQKLDAYLVKSSRPSPVLIEIHGGGWRRGSRSQFVYRGDLIGAILDAGISVVSIDYRLTPEHKFPAQMEDVGRAVQFVRSKAREWNLDPDRMGAMGGSAGAHLAAWVALHDDLAKPDAPDRVERLSSRLACFVALSGPMDLTRVRPTELARRPLRGQDFANAFTAAFGCTAEEYERDTDLRVRIRAASPVFLASRDDPPAFIMGAWGEDFAVLRDPPIPEVIDDPHSAWHGVLLAEALTRAGVPAVARIGPEVGKDPAADNAAIVAFLVRHLPDPPRRADPERRAPAEGPAGYWPLRGDCRDRSGHGNDGRARGEGAADGLFDGRASFVEVPSSPSLDLGTGDFTLCAWVWTARDTEDVVGDVLTRYDPARRRGFNLTIKSSSGGYNSHGDDRHVIFGIDDARLGVWQDCGRPSATSNYVSNSLTVFDGHLYAGITDAAREEDWCHVFRYRGRAEWEDCGRVGDLKTRGVGPLIVHQGHLYAATWNYDWTRVGIERPRRPRYEADFCRVYRYAGGTSWEECGQPGRNRRLFGMASFRGSLYVVGEDRGCYVRAGDTEWRRCGEFPNYAHPMAVHDGRLFAGVLNPAGVHAYDGRTWKPLGNPYGSEERCNQIHAIEVHRGELYATTWPEGRVAKLGDRDEWIDCGRLGDALEVNGLTVYNGKLYGGSIPRAEVFRYDGGTTWTSIRRFLDPAGYVFEDPNEWARVTSLTVYAGRLFAGMGSCTSSHLDAPCDFRGKVYSIEAGSCISFDRDLGSGWKHLAAVRRAGALELWVSGKEESASPRSGQADLDLTIEKPLLIGAGETDHFSGKIREVRIYRSALDPGEIASLAEGPAPE